MSEPMIKKPDWLRIRVRASAGYDKTEEILRRLSLNTVCEEANCPNRAECFTSKTATFIILGRVCTRNCTFCNIAKGKPEMVDPLEPDRIGQAVKEMGLAHAVITSVTRDDLPDGGSGHFARVVEQIRDKSPHTVIEILIPDFLADKNALGTVMDVSPNIINHNVETVERLYGSVRPKAVYQRSLKVLRYVKESRGDIYTKSGLMLGLGEREEEVLKTFYDIAETGCDFLTLGQYLSPSRSHYPVVEYIHPDKFEEYGEKAKEAGFKFVASGPLVRSSYHAREVFENRDIL